MLTIEKKVWLVQFLISTVRCVSKVHVLLDVLWKFVNIATTNLIQMKSQSRFTRSLPLLGKFVAQTVKSGTRDDSKKLWIMNMRLACFCCCSFADVCLFVEDVLLHLLLFQQVSACSSAHLNSTKPTTFEILFRRVISLMLCFPQNVPLLDDRAILFWRERKRVLFLCGTEFIC